MYEIIEGKKKQQKESGEVRRNENDSKHFFPQFYCIYVLIRIKKSFENLWENLSVW